MWIKLTLSEQCFQTWSVWQFHFSWHCSLCHHTKVNDLQNNSPHDSPSHLWKNTSLGRQSRTNRELWQLWVLQLANLNCVSLFELRNRFPSSHSTAVSDSTKPAAAIERRSSERKCKCTTKFLWRLKRTICRSVASPIDLFPSTIITMQFPRPIRYLPSSRQNSNCYRDFSLWFLFFCSTVSCKVQTICAAREVGIVLNEHGKRSVEKFTTSAVHTVASAVCSCDEIYWCSLRDARKEAAGKSKLIKTPV